MDIPDIPMKKTFFSLLLPSLVAVCGICTAASAQTTAPQTVTTPARTVTLDADDTQYLVNALKAQPVLMTPRLEALIRRIRGDFGSPGANFGVTTGYGLAAGQAFVGLSALYDDDGRGRINGTRRVDGSASAGIGFGDPVKGIALEMTMSVMSTNPGDSGFGDSGDVGLKVHKIFPHLHNLGVAVGWSNAGKWGSAQTAKDTVYAVASMDLPVQLVSDYPLQATLGMGNGTFRSARSLAENTNKVNTFGSLGTQLSQRTAVSASWSGNALNVGVGLLPFDAPVSVMLGITDVTKRTAEGKGYNLNIGYSFNY